VWGQKRKCVQRQLLYSNNIRRSTHVAKSTALLRIYHSSERTHAYTDSHSVFPIDLHYRPFILLFLFCVGGVRGSHFTSRFEESRKVSGIIYQPFSISLGRGGTGYIMEFALTVILHYP
jgi:hypothetical protein